MPLSRLIGMALFTVPHFARAARRSSAFRWSCSSGPFTRAVQRVRSVEHAATQCVSPHLSRREMRT